MCGCLPFDDDAAQINEEVAAAKFRLRFPDWAQNISPDAKEFLALLLSPNVTQRATAAEALDHPWLRPPEEQRRLSQEQKKTLLASPKHLRSLPRSPACAC